MLLGVASAGSAVEWDGRRRVGWHVSTLSRCGAGKYLANLGWTGFKPTYCQSVQKEMNMVTIWGCVSLGILYFLHGAVQ